MSNKETLEEAAKKSFGEIWASLTTEQSEYLKGYIDRQIDMAKRRQAERMYTLQDLEKAYDLGVQAMNERGVYSRAMCDWDEVKQQFKKK
jgi:hypothetical protein